MSVSNVQIKQNESSPSSRRACDDCRSRKIKCIFKENICESCERRKLACTFDKKAPKKAPKKESATDSNTQLLSVKFENSNNTINSSQTAVDRTSAWVEQASAELTLFSDSSIRTSESPFVIKTDAYGSLNVMFDSEGNKIAHFSICTQESLPLRYTHASSTSLVNHPLEDLTAESCQTHEVLGLLTSQQIYLTIVFFAYVYPKNPTLDVANFKQQLMFPLSNSLLFLLNCICAIACSYGSNSKVRFDKTMFYFKALETHYYSEDSGKHPNWVYGHSLLKELNPKLAPS